LRQPAQRGEIVTDSRALQHPLFAEARIQTPLLIKISDVTAKPVTEEYFGPVSFAIATNGTADSIAIAERIAREHGALTLSAYTTDDVVKEQLLDAAVSAGVALSLNLNGGVFVNQSAAFSDYHGTGANPAQLAHGISIALYNTGFGLAIAMPSLVFYRHFRALVR